MNELENIDSVDIAIKKWLEATAGGGLLAVQSGDQPDSKKPRLMFDLISTMADDFNCSGHDYLEVTDNNGQLPEGVNVGDVVPHQCTIQEYRLTYQVDAIYCRNNLDYILRIVKMFKAGMYKRFGTYLNLEYIDNSVIRRTHFIRDNRRHFKSTVDIEFVYRCKLCVPVNTIEVINLQPCDHLDTVGALTVSKT